MRWKRVFLQLSMHHGPVDETLGWGKYLLIHYEIHRWNAWLLLGWSSPGQALGKAVAEALGYIQETKLFCTNISVTNTAVLQASIMSKLLCETSITILFFKLRPVICPVQPTSDHFKQHSLPTARLLSSPQLPLNPLVHNRRNVQIIQLQMRKVPIPFNSNIPQANPIRASPDLLQIRNDAVVVRDVRARRPSQRNVGDARDVWQRVQNRVARLQDAAAVGGRVDADGGEV